MKIKLLVLVSFLLIVGATVQAVAEENIFFGTWIIPWSDGTTVIQVKSEYPVPDVAIVVYSWGSEGNGVCTQARISDSTLVIEYDGTIIVLRADNQGIVGERYSTTRLKRTTDE